MKEKKGSGLERDELRWQLTHLFESFRAVTALAAATNSAGVAFLKHLSCDEVVQFRVVASISLRSYKYITTSKSSFPK